MREIRDDIGDGPTWAPADRITDAYGCYVANLIAGQLDVNAGSKPYLLTCRNLEKANRTAMARFVDDSQGLLWPQGNEERPGILYTDAVPYTIKAAEALKVFYLHLLHITCTAD